MTFNFITVWLVLNVYNVDSLGFIKVFIVSWQAVYFCECFMYS